MKKNIKIPKKKLKIYNPKLKEECGVFGISNSNDAAALTALGLHALQLRGQVGCGIVTLILFPKVKPYFKNIIDSEYVLDLTLGVTIFILVIFIILMINKGISKTVKYSGFGSLDSVFGFFFGFIRGYIVCLLVFSAIDIVYNYDKWPINFDKSYTFPYIEKGSNYLIKEFPNEKKYQDSKEKIEDL